MFDYQTQSNLITWLSSIGFDWIRLIERSICFDWSRRDVGMYNYSFYARIGKITNTPRSYACDHWLSIESNGTCSVHVKTRRCAWRSRDSVVWFVTKYRIGQRLNFGTVFARIFTRYPSRHVVVFLVEIKWLVCTLPSVCFRRIVPSTCSVPHMDHTNRRKSIQTRKTTCNGNTG